MSREKRILGWREWAGLPTLQVNKVKVKVDTGARTSSLHVSDLKVFRSQGIPYVRFTVHPSQKKSLPVIEAVAELKDIRYVKSSSGKQTLRPIIHTALAMGDQVFVIELNLVNRDMMGFRMLLGRTALKNRFLVDTGKSFLMGEPIILS